MKPKPRSAFHIFKLPAATPLYFPFAFSPLFWQSGFFAPTSRSVFA